MASLRSRLAHSWDAFKHPESIYERNNGPGSYITEYGSSSNPMHVALFRTSKDSIVAPIYNQIAIDAAAITINHARVDENGKLLDVIHSGLNECLTVDANLDQTGRTFIQDAVMSMLDEGCIAIVPTETSVSPMKAGGFDIKSLRVGKITSWYPDRVKVNVYNEKVGRHQEIMLPKKVIAIVENPLYAVMNEPNSALQRLIRKLNLLDSLDERANSSKLDLLISLPYVVRGETKTNQAKKRKEEIEDQLVNSKYGIAYIDATEKVTQLNRPIENNLLEQIKYLYEMVFNQLGLTEDVFKGSADEATMINYYNKTIEPILSAICGEMKRKFLTKTARTRGQSIVFFRDPFRLVPVTELAKIADTLSRNAILSSNEFRGIIGYKPVDDERADELTNKNMPQEEPAPEDTDNYYNGYEFEQ